LVIAKIKLKFKFLEAHSVVTRCQSMVADQPQLFTLN